MYQGTGNAQIVPYQSAFVVEPEENPSNLVPFIELPVYGVPPPDRKWSIDAICRQLDQGQFSNAGRLGDSILRDARIRGAYEQRLAGLFGAPLEIEPADDTAKAVKAADDVKDRWGQMFPRPALEELHRYGITQGIGIAEKVWDTSTTPWTFRIKVWHPQFYLWLWPTRSYYLTTLDRGLVRVPERSTQFICYAPYGYERAYLLGNLRALLDPWLFRGWNKSDWGSYNEMYGRPIKQAVVPQMATPAEEKQYVKEVSTMGANSVVKSRQDKDGNRYAVELIEAKSTGWETFKEALAWSSDEIAQVLLGQTMSMDGQGGLGSQEEPGKAVRADIRSSDNEKLCECLYEQGVKQYVEFAHGNPDKAPRPNYLVDPKEDELAVAQADQAKSNAASARITAMITTREEEAIAIGQGKKIAEVIDVEARRKNLDKAIQKLEAQADNELQAAQDPEPTPGEKNKQNQQAMQDGPPMKPKGKKPPKEK